jgi:hypothetical protein
MNNRITIQEELKALNSVLPLEKSPEVYSVPKGYFEGFAALMLQRIKAAEQANSASDEISALSPLLTGLSKKMPYSVPENYFSRNTEELNELVNEKGLPEILHGIKEMPYSVPSGYFENFPELILKKVNPRQAKVISISSSRKWMRYATAAVIIGVVAISSIFYFNNGKSVDPASQPNEWVAKKLKNVPDKELDEFINTTVSTATIAKTNNGNKTEVRKLLKDIPDSELDKFLDEVNVEEDLSLIN